MRILWKGIIIAVDQNIYDFLQAMNEMNPYEPVEIETYSADLWGNKTLKTFSIVPADCWFLKEKEER